MDFNANEKKTTVMRQRYNGYNDLYDAGTIIIETDNTDYNYRKVKIADGIHYYHDLPYLFDTEGLSQKIEYDRSNRINEMENLRNQIRYEMKSELNEMKDKMNRSITYIHSCKSCGAKLEIPEDKNIFYCKYCDSMYVIGPVRLNSTI